MLDIAAGPDRPDAGPDAAHPGSSTAARRRSRAAVGCSLRRRSRRPVLEARGGGSKGDYSTPSPFILIRSRINSRAGIRVSRFARLCRSACVAPGEAQGWIRASIPARAEGRRPRCVRGAGDGW